MFVLLVNGLLAINGESKPPAPPVDIANGAAAIAVHRQSRWLSRKRTKKAAHALGECGLAVQQADLNVAAALHASQGMGATAWLFSSVNSTASGHKSRVN